MAGAIELEKHLETWIERDPDLVERGLLVVRRQMQVDGGQLDLLCVDLQGRPTVVEIKRGRLIRETIAQGMDYASSIATITSAALRSNIEQYLAGREIRHPGLAALLEQDSDGEREVAIVVVGVGAEPGLERMIDFLGNRYGIPIRAITFDVFDLGNGEKILVREETEPEAAPTPTDGGYTQEAVIARAGGPHSPMGRRMLKLAEAAAAHNLYVRPYKWSLMFTPPDRHTRYLMTVWKWSDKDELGLSYSADAFGEFFPIDADEVRRILGPDDNRVPILDDGDIQRWVSALSDLFSAIAENQVGPPHLPVKRRDERKPEIRLER